MNTLIQASKNPIVLPLNITIFLILKMAHNFIHGCIECQRIKHSNMNIQTAPAQSFSEHAPSFNYRTSMDTKGTINTPSQQ